MYAKVQVLQLGSPERCTLARKRASRDPAFDWTPLLDTHYETEREGEGCSNTKSHEALLRVAIPQHFLVFSFTCSREESP